MSEPAEFGERALSAAQNFIKQGQEVARREGKILKLQTQMSRMRTQRQQLLAQMGDKVFSLFERDLVKNQDLRMMCQQVRGLDAELELKREEVAQLRRPDVKGEHGVDSEPEAQAEILEEDEDDEFAG